LALFVIVGFAVAGCGSSKKAASGPITIAGTTTISGVKVGTLLRCKNGPSIRTPHWFGFSYLRVPGVPGVIVLRHRYNGSVSVSCRH
jgi:hypothetical protein